jgi:general secretion pathway protein K
MPIVATLWSLALLAAVSTSLAFTGDITYRQAQNSFQVAYNNALVDAAVNRAVLALLDPRTASGLLRRTADQKFEFGGALIRLRVRDELGKIDLNQTDGSALVKLFESAGIDGAAAEALADKVLDWRDTIPFKRVNGAKADEYRAAGYDYEPRNGPFQSVDELQLVMGMTRELYQRVEPALTVYSGRQFVDPQSAAPEVITALPWLAEAQATSQLAGAAMVSGMLGPPMSAFKGRAFTIDAEISRSSEVVRRRCTVRLTGNPTDPFWMLIRQRT